MTYNDGIEAAANHIRRQLQHAAPDQGVILSGLVYEIEALKRPEPSSAEKPSPVVQSKVVCSEVEQLLRRAESLIAAGKGLPFKPSFGMLVIEWMRQIQKEGM